MIRGLALAVILFASGTLAAAFAAGGSLPMIAIGLILAGASMDLFQLVPPRDGD